MAAQSLKVMEVLPVILQGAYVRLEPLSLGHHEQLCEVGLAEELWTVTMTRLLTGEDMRVYIEEAIRLQEAGSALPFAIIELSSGKAVGSTRYGNIDRVNRRVEIGWTWVAVPWQRTAVNTECKYLLLRHAFEVLHCVRVEFKTDVVNTRSRQALLRIGAREEGILRRHMITPTGRIRDTVYYSILDDDWAVVKSQLESMLRFPRRKC